MVNSYQRSQDNDSPFRRWRFEEAASSTTFAEDIASSTATASGTVTSGIAYPTIGVTGPGVGADFAGGFCTLTGVSGWAPSTIEALVTLDTVPPTTSSNRPAIFTHAFSAGQTLPLTLGWNLDGGHQGLLGIGWYNGTSWLSVHASSLAVTTGVVHHIVGTLTGGGALSLYVDGALVASGTVTARTIGTVNTGAYIGRRYDATANVIDGRVWDLALYSTALSGARVAVHAGYAAALSGGVISGGGQIGSADGHAIAVGDPATVTGGGGWKASADEALAVPISGWPWTSAGELTGTPSGVRQTWAYKPASSGTLAVDTTGSGWNQTLTVYAADRTTVVASGANAATAAVTGGSTYYVTVTGGSGSTGNDGRYVLNATGPATTDATWSPETPAPAPPSIPAASSPPSGMTVVPIRRVSEVFPAPTLTAGRPVGWVASSRTEADWGTLRVVSAGVDVTYFRGYPVQVLSYELQEPFGCGPATISFPGITPHDTVGTGDTNWLIGGYQVDILNGSTILWSGFIGRQSGRYDADRAGYVIDCVGELWMADSVAHQPRTYLPPVDVGSMVPVVFNLVPHRRVNGITQVSTGIKTTQRGTAGSSVIEYVQELLASATTDDGSNQWTVGRVAGSPRTYSMRLKDRSTVHWTMRTGQPGLEAHLELDSTTATNRVFGRGVAPNGYAWAGWVYPGAGNAGQTTAYPFSSPSSTLTVGSTDAGTTSGSGVSDWQRRINETGIVTVAVDGSFSAADATAARTVQTAKGLTVDGVVGPQTWAASFDVGANGAALDSAYRAPLAALSSVTSNLTNADGSVGGANPSDNRNLIVVDRDEDFGDGITKAEAIRSAKAELARTATPGWVGEVVLKADPNEGSRFDIREGQNFKLQGWTGRDVLLHIASVAVTPPSEQDEHGTVRLTVDEHARDLVTIGGILRRNREAAKNPAMLPARSQRRSAARPDSVVEYDGESSGGIIPKHALYGGLWTVIRVPVSQAGKVAQVKLTTTGPASPFCVAFFGDQVTPADLAKWVGNPLAQRSDGYGPFDIHYDQLTTLGFVEAIGGPGQAAGYSPGYETSPYNALATTLTGRLVSTGSWTYQSSKPPWLWVAEYSPSSCFISGRIYPAPIDT